MSWRINEMIEILRLHKKIKVIGSIYIYSLRILRDKTFGNKLMNTLIMIEQNYPFYRLKLLVEKFGH